MKVTTPEFRMSYPHLFTPKMNELSKKEEFSVVALFKKGQDLKVLEQAIEAAKEKKWGKDKTKWPANIRSPLRDQKERAKDGALPNGYEAGAIFVNLKSDKQPGIVNQNRQAILDEAEMYAGAYVRATVTAYAYDRLGNKGVAFGLNNIQKLREGDSLGGRVKAENDFEAVPMPVDSEATDQTSLFD